jgi:hypothetical protein
VRSHSRAIGAALCLLTMVVAVGPATGQIRSGGTGSGVKGSGRVAGPPMPTPVPLPTPTSPSAPPKFYYRPHLPPLFLGHRGVHWPLIGWGSIGFAYVPEWYGGVPFAPPIAPLPDDAPRGGLQLDIEPRRAEVYIDGHLVGRVEEFSGYYQHLPLTAGPHLVQVIANDYEPLSFEVMIAPGRTTTYRWSMTRAPGR